jgi:TM2 domain-containing membrane protein YozV
MNQKRTSYLLWLFWLVGFAGIHRLHNKKIFTGLLWLFTGGLLGIGQLVDLFLIPNMVDEYNTKARTSFGLSPTGVPYQSTIETLVQPSFDSRPVLLTQDQLMLKLLKAAEARGGKLSVTQAVLDTECSFSDVENTLRAMAKTGYVAIENDPTTGIVLYDFVEL